MDLKKAVRPATTVRALRYEMFVYQQADYAKKQ